MRLNHLFKVPKVPTEVIVEEKVTVAVPKRVEPPPAKGISWDRVEITRLYQSVFSHCVCSMFCILLVPHEDVVA